VLATTLRNFYQYAALYVNKYVTETSVLRPIDTTPVALMC